MSTTATTTPETWRHPVNIGHLVMGLAFTGLVVVWALVQYDVVDGDDIRWLLPVPWVLAGAIGLVASALTARRHGQQQTGWVQPAATQPDPDAPIDTTDTTQEI